MFVCSCSLCPCESQFEPLGWRHVFEKRNSPLWWKIRKVKCLNELMREFAICVTLLHHLYYLMLSFNSWNKLSPQQDDFWVMVKVNKIWTSMTNTYMWQCWIVHSVHNVYWTGSPSYRKIFLARRFEVKELLQQESTISKNVKWITETLLWNLQGSSQLSSEVKIVKISTLP